MYGAAIQRKSHSPDSPDSNSGPAVDSLTKLFYWIRDAVMDANDAIWVHDTRDGRTRVVP